MKFKELFISLWRRFPLFRLFTIVAVIVLVTGAITLVTKKAVVRIPSIDSISPQFGSPGDIMEIYGKHFGSVRNQGYVEIGGSRLTASSYLVWNDDKIRVILPTNVQDGLVVVGTKSGRSKKNSFFANESGIPVAVPAGGKTLVPSIASVSPQTAAPGSIVVITGSNFGAARNESLVYFTSHRDYGQNLDAFETDDENVRNSFEYVFANGENYDYEMWTDTEIHVRVPDGANSGILFVKTDKGSSNQFALDVNEKLGTRIYQNMRHYIIQINADIEDKNSRQNTSIALRVPRPLVYTRQPYTDLLEVFPEPSMQDYNNTVCHVIEMGKKKKSRYTHKFVVYTYALQTQIKEDKITSAYLQEIRPGYEKFLQPDMIVRSDDAEVLNLAKTFIGKEKNPYKRAKLVYNYMIDNYKILNELRSNSDSNGESYNLFKEKSGDAYDFATGFTALLRACNIPAVPVAGILVDADKKAQNHWWTEFYIEDFGWIPVDVSLAAGLEYKGFGAVEDLRGFYFGNMDSQHIAFSRGWNELQQTLSNGNGVYRPKTYAFQSFWEESTAGTVNYSSLWNDPVIVGIY